MFTIKTGQGSDYIPSRSSDPALYNKAFSTMYEAERYLKDQGYERSSRCGRTYYENPNKKESAAYIYNPLDGTCWR